MTTALVRCPVSDFAHEHFFPAGEGYLVKWDVMGDPRPAVEVCDQCAPHGEPVDD